MQSVTSKIFMATLRMIFHSPLSDSSKLSDNAAKLTKDKSQDIHPQRTLHIQSILLKMLNTKRLLIRIAIQRKLY